jgi:hypothetical protein
MVLKPWHFNYLKFNILDKYFVNNYFEVCLNFHFDHLA